MTAPHCQECADFADHFGFSDAETADLARWHVDHPGWRIPEVERQMMADYQRDLS